MKNKIIVCIGFIVCFGIGFMCGMYAQSRIINSQNNIARNDLTELADNENNSQKTSDAGKCHDGTSPDENGCCPGEEYTDMGELGFNCCPPTGDCFPPIIN